MDGVVGTEVLRLEHATIGYPKRMVLRDVSLSVARGECVAVMGPNGSGKSTLLMTLLGLLPPLAGEVRWPGGREPALGYVPQRDHLDPLFPLTVAEVVAMGAYRELWPLGLRRSALKERIAEVLGRVGGGEWSRRVFGELSGGQKQRVLIARALLGDPELLLMDEPTSGVDLASEEAIVVLLQELLRGGLTAILVSHHVRSVQRIGSRVVWVRRGEIEIGPVDEVLQVERVMEMLAE